MDNYCIFVTYNNERAAFKLFNAQDCIGCCELTQKGSRRIISDSTDILSLWEEALKKFGRDKGQKDDRFM